MASACKAGVVVVTVVGGGSCSLTSFKSKVLQLMVLEITVHPLLMCCRQGSAGGDLLKPWAAAALVVCPAPCEQLLLLYGGTAGELFCSKIQLQSTSSTDVKPSASSAVELRDRGHSRTIFTIRARSTAVGVQVVRTPLHP
jgi:hypothetical protein